VCRQRHGFRDWQPNGPSSLLKAFVGRQLSIYVSETLFCQASCCRAPLSEPNVPWPTPQSLHGLPWTCVVLAGLPALRYQLYLPKERKVAFPTHESAAESKLPVQDF
jgi:hypothetical protein